MEVVRLREAAGILGLSRARVHQLMREGKLSCAKRRPILFDRAEVEAFARQERKQGRPFGWRKRRIEAE